MTQDILIFLGISFVILAVVFAVIFIIVRAIIKFIISLFKKKPQPHQMEGALVDKGEDLSVNVEALEKSRMQRATMQYNQPISGKKPEEQMQADKEKEWIQKSQEKIESGLKSLKDVDKDMGEEPREKNEPPKSFLEKQMDSSKNENFSTKIKIPVAKKYQASKGSVGAPIKGQFEKNQEKESVEGEEKKNSVTAEDVKRYNVSIDKRMQAREESPGAIFFEKLDFMKNKPESAASGNIKKAEQKDSSIFGGKQELTRSELREKLRDPKLDTVEKSFGLDMTPAQRANLEKQLFPSSYGGNISKSDIRIRMQGLGRKMLSEKNPQAKATLRRQINFIKKIGGIK